MLFLIVIKTIMVITTATSITTNLLNKLPPYYRLTIDVYCKWQTRRTQTDFLQFAVSQWWGPIDHWTEMKSICIWHFPSLPSMVLLKQFLLLLSCLRPRTYLYSAFSLIGSFSGCFQYPSVFTCSHSLGHMSVLIHVLPRGKLTWPWCWKPFSVLAPSELHLHL